MMVLLHFHLDIIKYKFMLLIYIYMSISANTKHVLVENLYYSPNT